MQAKPSLKDADRKVARARWHLGVVADSLASFLRRGPYEWSVEPDPAPSEYALVAKRREGLPDDLPLVVGELLHNARSALDVVVGEVSTLKQDQKADRAKLQFPIVSKEDDWDEKAKKQLRDVPRPVVDLIREMQPFGVRRAEFSWLPDLRDASNADKHRLLHGVVAVGALSKVVIRRLVGSQHFGVGVGAEVGLEPGAKLSAPDFALAVDSRIELHGERHVVARIHTVGKVELPLSWTVGYFVVFDEACPELQGKSVPSVLAGMIDGVEQAVTEIRARANQP